MTPRPCNTPGCTNYTTTGPRCPTHESAHQHTRNTTRLNGTHRTQHTQARHNLTPTVTAGTTCYRCHQPIQPNQPWDADNTPNGWQPSHATCNRKANTQGQGAPRE